jgi:hypothetical protein
MRIKNKARFTIGIIDILLSITGFITCIVQQRTRGFSMLGFCFACGIVNIIYGIETKAQRQKRKEELQAMAKMYGWDKDGDAE